MKSYRLSSVIALAAVIAAGLVLVPGARAASPAAADKTNGPAGGTNSGPVELPVPLAIFDLTNTVVKDPFFPNTLRHPVHATNNATAAFSISSIVLKGLAGTTSEPLALINNKTLAVGEDAEITTAAGKVRIRVVEIKKSSVLIRSASLPDVVEIYLRKSAQ